MEKEAEEEEKPVAKEEEEKAKEQRQGPTAAKEQQQDDDDDDDDDDEDDDDDDERYDMVAKILVYEKLVYEGKCVKAFRVIGNLNNSNTKMIMANIAPHNEIRTKYFIQLNH